MEKAKIRVTPPTEKEIMQHGKRLITFGIECSKSSGTLSQINYDLENSLRFINSQLAHQK